MLSRTADHLYWMSATSSARRTSRACSMRTTGCRSCRARRRRWSRAGGHPHLARHDRGVPGAHGRSAPRAAFISSPSIARTARQHPLLPDRGARERTRGARHDHLGLWETLNATYLDSRAFDANTARRRRAPNFVEWVKYRSHLTRGVTSGTMLRDEAYHFTAHRHLSSNAPTTPRGCSRRAGAIPGGTGRAADRRRPRSGPCCCAPVRVRGLPQGLSRIGHAVARHRAAAAQCRDAALRALLACPTCCAISTPCTTSSRSETERYAGELHARFRYGRLEELCADGVPRFSTRSRGDCTDSPSASARTSWSPGISG